MNKKQVKAYITKHALTEGVYVVEGRVEGDMFVCSNGACRQYFHGKDWHTSLESAKSRAVEMRDRKIESLQKQLARLQDLKIADMTNGLTEA